MLWYRHTMSTLKRRNKKKNFLSLNISSLMNGKWHLFCYIYYEIRWHLKIHTRINRFVNWSISVWKGFILCCFSWISLWIRSINYSVKMGLRRIARDSNHPKSKTIKIFGIFQVSTLFALASQKLQLVFDFIPILLSH